MEIGTIGLDLAKNIFQVHGVDPEGKVVVRRVLRRAQVLPFFAKLPPCLVGMEACGTAHHWARELARLGHDVKRKPDTADPRLVALLARKPTRVATVAMANRTARVVWAIMARGETYRAGHQPRLAA